MTIHLSKRWAKYLVKNLSKLALFLCGMFFIEFMFHLSALEQRQNENLPREVNDPDGALWDEPLGALVSNETSQNKRKCNCSAVMNGDADELDSAESFQRNSGKSLIRQHTREMLSLVETNCSTFLIDREYHLRPSSVEESEFPLAFSILIYDNVRQTERLLRAIYRPQNVYCIHVDGKSSKSTKVLMRRLVQCFPNVFMVNRAVDVHWGTFSVLEADLNCMKDLLSRPGWRYFINLTGKEFPLKTNWELVEILKIYNGANEVNAKIARQKEADKKRYKFSHNRETGAMTNVPKSPPPFNLTIVKGSVHVTLTRAFVHFLLTDDKVQQFLAWTRDTFIPDELVFATINYNPQVFKAPGSFTGELPDTNSHTKPFLSRYKEWQEQSIPCHGKFVRHICIYGVRDIRRLRDLPHFFVNKLSDDYQPVAYDCLEELIRNRTSEEYQGRHPVINRSFYSQQPAVLYHL